MYKTRSIIAVLIVATWSTVASAQLFPLFRPLQAPQCEGPGCGVIQYAPPQQFYSPPQYQQPAPYAAPQQAPLSVVLPPQVQNAIVRVACRDRNQRGRNIGSGTIVESDADGSVVLTCAHLVDANSGPDFEVTLPNGTNCAGRLLDVDPTLDLAAVEIRSQLADVVKVAAQEPPEGETTRFAGYGGNGAFSAREGRLVAYVTIAPGPERGTIEVSNGCRSGDSGGPILNASYQLVGVIKGSNGPEAMSHGAASSYQVVRYTPEPQGPIVNGTSCRHIRPFLDRIRAIRDRIHARRQQRRQQVPAARPPAQQPPVIEQPAPSLPVELPPPDKTKFPPGQQPFQDENGTWIYPGPESYAPADDPEKTALEQTRDVLTADLERAREELKSLKLIVEDLKKRADQVNTKIDLPAVIQDAADEVADHQGRPAETIAKHAIAHGLTGWIAATFGIAAGPAGWIATAATGLLFGAGGYLISRKRRAVAGPSFPATAPLSSTGASIPADNSPAIPPPVTRDKLLINNVPTTDHEYNRLLEAIQREVAYNPTAGPIAQRILSTFQQLTSGAPIADQEKVRANPKRGQTLGWQDPKKEE